MTRKSLLSALTIATVGLGSRAFLKYLSDIKVVGLPRLLDELDRIHEGGKGRGVMTVSNHISVVDEPLTWGVLPASHYLRAKPMRWTLGAADIMFTNSLFSEFFRQGQVLETFRGRGVMQPAVDKAIELLDDGAWIHIFPEGKVTQPPHSNLGRLKWGIGRMLMESKQLPTIIPMWITGFDQVMNESRRFPRFIPRPGKTISITFGSPDAVQSRVSSLRAQVDKDRCLVNSEDDAALRSTITLAVQDALESLGRQVSGEVIEDLKEGKVT